MHVVQIILPILPYVELRAFVKSPRTRIQTNEKRGLTNAGKRQHVRDEAIVREKSVSVAAAGRGRLSSSSFCVLRASVRPSRRVASDAGRGTTPVGLSVGLPERRTRLLSLGEGKEDPLPPPFPSPFFFARPKFLPRGRRRGGDGWKGIKGGFPPRWILTCLLARPPNRKIGGEGKKLQCE